MAKKAPPAKTLEVHEDAEFQRREWIFQRVGWGAMAILVFAALLGLLGQGPLSSAGVATADGAIRVEYDRFLHYHAQAELKIFVRSDIADSNELRLWVDRDFLAGIELQSVTPEPERVEAGSDRHVFVFRIADRSKLTLVTFLFEPDEIGSLTCRLGTVESEAAQFGQFVYP